MNLSEFNLNKKSGVLPNGVRVVVFERPNSPVYMRVISFAGARYGTPGLAHFAEHMLVSGNEKFKTKQEISRYVSDNALYTNAWTNKVVMFLESKAHDQSDFAKIAELADLFLTKSLFDSKIVETERGAILQEMRQAHTNRDKLFGELMSSLLFQGTYMESPVLGDTQYVNGYTAEDLKKYVKNTITADNTTIVVAGGVSYQDVVNAFSTIKLPRGAAPVFTPLKLNRTKHIHIEYDENTKDVKLGIVFPTVPWSNRRERLALHLLSSILGASQSSVLYRRLRYEKGYVYGVQSSNFHMPDVGRFNITTSVAKEHLKETLSIIAEEINNIKKGNLDEGYLNGRKSFMKKILASQLESISEVVERHQDHALLGFDLAGSIIDDAEEAQSITKDEIIAVANAYFTNDKWYGVLMGPVKDEDMTFSL